jgi:hypothetical protein
VLAFDDAQIMLKVIEVGSHSALFHRGEAGEAILPGVAEATTVREIRQSDEYELGPTSGHLLPVCPCNCVDAHIASPFSLKVKAASIAASTTRR